jgi:hypothetical protein
MYYINKDIIRYEGGAFTEVCDKVIMEDEIEVLCGQELLGRYPCTNKERELLALGLAYCHGYQVNTETPVQMVGKSVQLPELPLRKDIGEIIQSDLFYEAELVLENMRQLRDMPGLFTETGGTHNGALMHHGKLRIWSEDISRHCMVDKLIGATLRNNWEFPEVAILLSCRVSDSIMEKLVVAGIPIVVSMSAVTDKAIELAKSHEVTLAGFVRGKRMNLYYGKRIGIGEKSD